MPSATPSCGCWNDTRMRRRSGAIGARRALSLRRCRRCLRRRPARTPDAVAVVFEERQLSYAALEAHANRLAHHLRALGVGPETVVGLCVERSPEMVVGLLGILKAGGAYLPLDPNYPRGAAVVHAGRCRRAGAGDAAGAARHAAGGSSPRAGRRDRRRLVRLDADWPADRAAAAHRARTSPSIPRHPAYVIYTSGSTGTPKGVVVEHGALRNFLALDAGAGSARPDDRLLARHHHRLRHRGAGALSAADRRRARWSSLAGDRAGSPQLLARTDRDSGATIDAGDADAVADAAEPTAPTNCRASRHLPC